jgi:hypothetical protein
VLCDSGTLGSILVKPEQDQPTQEAISSEGHNPSNPDDKTITIKMFGGYADQIKFDIENTEKVTVMVYPENGTTPFIVCNLYQT